jgi:hypothetical protein
LLLHGTKLPAAVAISVRYRSVLAAADATSEALNC